MITISNHAASAATDAVCSLLDGGSLRIFNRADVLLAELKFQPKAFRPAIDGLAASHPLIDEDNAKASGMAHNFIACDPAGAPIFSGLVGGTDENGITAGDMVMDNPHIAAGARVQVDAVTFQFTCG